VLFELNKLHPLIVVDIKVLLVANSFEILEITLNEVEKVSISGMKWVYDKPFYLLLI
jgi:hypothetical protein